MADAILASAGVALLVAGLALATVALYGMLRRREIMEQLHAAGLVTGPAIVLILLASIGTANADVITSALLVLVFAVLTSPLGSHAIAQAAYYRPSGEPAAQDEPEHPAQAEPGRPAGQADA